MLKKVSQCLLLLIIVYVVAFEEFFYVFAQVSQEMMEQGRNQYQILQERGNLPQYGPCWKAAIEHLEEGCRALTEEVQSDMALHLANCFLEMSGHDTYNCELNKKPNLKAICINDMSDRAFHVYTEFYTHSQNMCWFLRGQIWHETIAENTLKVGKQLQSSANSLEKILERQQESLELQEKLLTYGKSLEKVMEDFYISTREHQQVMNVMTNSLNNLQSWLIGEVSWLDTIIFYLFAVILIFFLTASPRTSGARLPIFFLLFLNVCLERTISLKLSNFSSNKIINIVHQDLNWYVWICRYFFSIFSFLLVIYKACTYKDFNFECYIMLQEISEKVGKNGTKGGVFNDSLSNVSNLSVNNEKFTTGHLDSFNYKPKTLFKALKHEQFDNNRNGGDNLNTVPEKRCKSPVLDSYKKISTEKSHTSSSYNVRVKGRYNLRAKTETPDKTLP